MRRNDDEIRMLGKGHVLLASVLLGREIHINLFFVLLHFFLNLLFSPGPGGLFVLEVLLEILQH